MALFLALAAIQFVVAQNLPASSYVTPLGQLIVASYFTLFLAALESLLVFNFAVYAERQRRCAMPRLRSDSFIAAAAYMYIDARCCRPQRCCKGYCCET